MIIGIGVDIVEIGRIAKSLERFGERFEQRVFTKGEILKAETKANLNIKINYYAKRFAAKEAFSKAIGLGIGRGINFTDIEIINDEKGKPKIKLNSNAKHFLQKHLKQNNFKIDVSMSDTKEIAEAFVIVSEGF
ncbi:MAG: holo-[acyl-carrier protein] synthase [Rickettsiales bacterium]|jgi:holo-[acyl-carrier protein] synthase